MADDPNAPWECTGNPPGSHKEIENYGDTCLLCPNQRRGLKPPKGGGGSEKIPWRGIAAAAVLPILGIAGWLWMSRPKPPEPEKVVQSVSPTTSPTISPTTTPSPILLPASAPERYSIGERRLFLGKPNADGDQGTQAFKASNYSQAKDFFEKAVQGDRIPL